MMILDLGCGKNKVPGSVGVDMCQLPGVDVTHELSRFPYPFETNSVDEIHMNHVLEHLDDTVTVLAELWRISKPGGRVHIRVPHFSGPYAWKDPTHKRCFTSETFNYFGANSCSYYTRGRFAVKSVRLRYFIDPGYRLVYRLWGRCVQWLLDAHPTFSERFVLYLIGGIDEIDVTLEAVK
jgi:SAM-dependent methyltransferase